MLKTTLDSRRNDSQESFALTWSSAVRRRRIPHPKGVTGRPSPRRQLTWQPLAAFFSKPKLLALIAFIALCHLKPVFADTIPVRQTDGPIHGFLLLQTLDGKTIGEGDLIETLRAGTVKTQTILRFHDGSYYEETSEFTQHGQFRLLSNHL